MKRVFLAILIVVFAVNVRAEELTGHYDDGLFYDDYVSSPADDALDDMYDVYESVRTFCGGLTADLSELTGISIANAVTTGVGTATATGALATGIAKANTDKKVDEMSTQIAEIICEKGGCDADTIETMSDQEFADIILPLLADAIIAENYETIKSAMSMKIEQDRAIAKSKRFGN